MKGSVLPALTFAAISLLSCEPAWEEEYEIFTLPKGKHSGTYPVQMLQSETLNFHAIFDESAKYESELPENQWDTNKLLGFSQCNSHHHENSARFGWRWINDALEIAAYCYVDGERVIEEMGAIALNEPARFSIQLTDENYIFILNNNPPVQISRSTPCEVGVYYMLWPYFGGDEVAPHDIDVRIRIDY